MQSRSKQTAPPSDPAEVRRAIRDSGPGAYLLLGDNGVDIEETVVDVVRNLTDDATRAFNYDSFSADEPECTGEAVANAVNAYPVLAEHRVVVLRAIEGARAAVGNELALLVAHPIPATVLVICGEKVDERTKWGTALKKHCTVFTLPVPRNIAPWARQRARTRGLSLESEAADLLAEFVGNDVFRAADAIEKLGLYTQPRTTITTEDVEAVVGIARTDTLYQMNDAIIAGDTTLAIQIAHRLQETGTPAATLAAAVLQHWTQLRAAADVIQNPGETSLKELIGENRDFILRKLTEAARAVGRERIRRGLRLALVTESALKSSWLSDKQAGLDALICQLAAAGRVAPPRRPSAPGPWKA